MYLKNHKIFPSKDLLFLSSCVNILIVRGGVAQLGECLNGIQEVVGSIPIVSTTNKTALFSRLWLGSAVFTLLWFQFNVFKKVSCYICLLGFIISHRVFRVTFKFYVVVRHSKLNYESFFIIVGPIHRLTIKCERVICIGCNEFEV